MMSAFENSDVKFISDYLQYYMDKNNIDEMTADECADLLAQGKVLSNKIGPKPGFNFRQMLRDGRDSKIDLVLGAQQNYPRAKWTIKRIKSY